MEPNKCPTCGETHAPCTRCGAPTRCPPDEPGEPFLLCDKCDAYDAAAEHDGAFEPHKSPYLEYALVYQGGMAHVCGKAPSDPGWFLLTTRTYKLAEHVAYGLVLASLSVTVYHYDGTGTVTKHADEWQPGPGPLFGHDKNPPIGATYAD